VSDNEYYCTPTGVSKGDLTPDMIIKVDKDGKKLEGKLNPSSEIKMHMRVYRERPDVTAVVHAHPPVATAFTVADIDLDQYVLPEAVLTIGAVPTCDYGTPSTMEIPDSLDPYLQDHDAFLLRNHGALTVGCNLTKAFFVMEEVEFNAVICKHAMDLGAVHEISKDGLKKLMDLRKKMNLPGRHPGIDYEDEAPACNCSKEELVEAITKKVLSALGK
jgi:L-fuculose-phosphate aldolase